MVPTFGDLADNNNDDTTLDMLFQNIEKVPLLFGKVSRSVGCTDCDDRGKSRVGFVPSSLSLTLSPLVVSRPSSTIAFMFVPFSISRKIFAENPGKMRIAKMSVDNRVSTWKGPFLTNIDHKLVNCFSRTDSCNSCQVYQPTCWHGKHIVSVHAHIHADGGQRWKIQRVERLQSPDVYLNPPSPHLLIQLKENSTPAIHTFLHRLPLSSFRSKQMHTSGMILWKVPAIITAEIRL